MSRFSRKRIRELASYFKQGRSFAWLRDNYRIGNSALIKRLKEARRVGLIDNIDLTRLIMDRTQYDFPEDSELRLEAVLSCMNSEIKQATLLMLDDVPQTDSEIRSRLSRLVNSEILPLSYAFTAYCSKTLVPIGFLVREMIGIDEYSVRNWRISSAGEIYGKPIAAFSLRYGVDNNLSQFSILASTFSPGDSRAPYNTALILESLVDSEILRIVDLGRRVRVDHSAIAFYLKRLKKIGFVDFESVGTEEAGWAVYEWVKGKPDMARAIPHNKTLTKRIAEFLFQHKRASRIDIVKALGYSHKPNVSRVLSGLERQGFIKTRWKGGEKHSEVSMLKKGKDYLEGYIKRIRSALDETDELKIMREMLEEFERDRLKLASYLEAGIQLYNSISPQKNKQTREDRESCLLEFIEAYQEEHGKGIRPIEIKRELGWRYRTVTRYVSPLTKTGKLRKERHGRETRYSIAD